MTRTARRFFAFLCTAGLFGAALDAQAPATFGGETTVVAVEIPVRVLADGEPVRGLTEGDFRVFDQGEQREISGFEVYDLATSTAAAGSAEDVPFAARRYFLLLFDLDFTDAAYLERAYEAGRELVDTGLRPSDMVAVAFFSNRSGVSSVLGFTPDQTQVRAALDQLGRYLGKEGPADATPGVVAGKQQDALGLTVGGWEAVLNDLGQAAQRERSLADETTDFIDVGEGSGSGKAGHGDFVAETIHDMADYAMEDMRQKRASRAAAMTDSLRDLAELYRWVDGQKYLVLFSRGFESDLYLDDGGSWLLTNVRNMIAGFRQAGWTIFSLEGADLNTPGNKARRESLLMVARETGGELISGSHDFTRAIGQVLEATDVTYVLTFQSQPLAEDGAYRDLRVELVDGSDVPRGARVVHRDGYFAPKPFGSMAYQERRVATAEVVLAGREIDEIGCRVLASPAERVDGDRVRVPVVLDVDAKSLLASRAWQQTRVEALSYAFDDAGAIVGSWGRDFVLVPDIVAKAARTGALVFYGEMTLPPGRYELRSLVRNVDDGRVTLKVTSLRVPELESADATLLEPIFAELVQKDEEESSRRILIRDVSSGANYPFTFGERRFLPALAPSVVRGTETTVIGRGTWSEPPSGLRALVFDSNGFPVPGGVAVRLLGVEGPEATAAVRQLALGFKPTALPAGDYELRLVFQNPEGGTVSSPPASFSVVDSTSAVD